MKVFIAAGHGGGDPGSVSNNTTEAAEVINIVDKCVDMLKKVADPQHEIIKVDDKFNLQDEVAVINDQTTDRDNDIAIEVHMNNNSGAPGTGTEIYYGTKTLAEKLYNEIVKNLGLKGRGVKDGNHLYFNNATTPASALLELGFLNNPEDLRIVREKGASALAWAVASVCGLPDPVEAAPKTLGEVTAMWFLQNITRIYKYFQTHPEAAKEVSQS